MHRLPGELKVKFETQNPERTAPREWREWRIAGQGNWTSDHFDGRKMIEISMNLQD